jgi:AICAR transformylase/IMP cyclohydrolase PurH
MYCRARFQPGSLGNLGKEENIRLLEMPEPLLSRLMNIVRSCAVAQAKCGFRRSGRRGLEVATDRQPSSAEMESLRFAWKAASMLNPIRLFSQKVRQLWELARAA